MSSTIGIPSKKQVIVESCPFCGSDAVDIKEFELGDMAVVCTNVHCLATGPVNSDAETAVNLWNAATHKPQQQIQQLTQQVNSLETQVVSLSATPATGPLSPV